MRWLSGCLGVVVLSLLLASCSGGGGVRSLEKIKSSGVLRVATRNAPTTYYLDRNGDPAGPEATKALAFAHHLGVKVHFVVRDSVADVLHTLQAHQADIAAAGLTDTSKREAHFLFGPHYQKITQQVVCSRKYRRLRSPADLVRADLAVISDSSYVARLKALQKDHPKLHWKTLKDVDTEQLLRRVWKGDLGCTVADSNIVALNRRFYPSLVIMFSLSKPQYLAWAMPKQATKLAGALQQWFRKYKANGGLASVNERYYAYIPQFDYVDNRALVRRIRTRFPKYRGLFEQAGKKYGIPPLLLAAQAYQESHWQANARSPTGVRGIMMLTRNTARSLGVKNRLDPAQSIRGGAKYLAKMKKKIGGKSSERDRDYLALAAYTIGYFHLQDAQKLAKKLGKNPNKWADMREVLPLLAQKRYYKSLQYGYVRGTLAVRYVSRIHNYLDIIKAHT